MSWRSQLVSLRRETERLSKLPESAPSPPDRAPAIHFLINTSLSTGAEGLVLDVFARNPDGAGQLGKPKAASVAADHLQELLLPEKLNDEQQAPLVVLGSLPADSPGRRDRSSKERSRPPGGPASLFAATSSEHRSASTLRQWSSGMVGWSRSRQEAHSVLGRGTSLAPNAPSRHQPVASSPCPRRPQEARRDRPTERRSTTLARRKERRA